MRSIFISSIIMLIIFFRIALSQNVDDFSLEQILSKKQQNEIGLQKLNSEEKKALSKLIYKIFLAGFEKGKEEGIKQAEEYIAKQNSTTDVIESQIDGEFEGWEGETIVKLMNGQIWQQSEYYYYYNYAYMPNVIIYKKSTGYKMKVEGIDKAVGVVRLN